MTNLRHYDTLILGALAPAKAGNGSTTSSDAFLHLGVATARLEEGKMS